jgi:hypothetical protein
VLRIAKSLTEYKKFGHNLENHQLVAATLKPLVRYIISVEPLTLDRGRKESIGIGMYNSREKMVTRLKKCKRKDEEGNADLNRYFITMYLVLSKQFIGVILMQLTIFSLFFIGVISIEKSSFVICRLRLLRLRSFGDNGNGIS